MTFNIAHGRTARDRVDLNRTARVIRDARVDVAGLQEVDRHFGARSGFVDQAAWLAQELGMYVAFGVNVDLAPPEPGAPRCQYGNAILSVEPILDWDNTLLPCSDVHEQRGLLRARIDVRGEPWQVYVTHLQYDDPAERLAQAEAVAEIVGASVGPAVLMGDLNATPDTPEVRALTATLVDTWQVAGRRPGWTSPNPVPNRRIDYVMRTRGGQTHSAKVVWSARAWVTSDHRPVVADVAPPPTPPPPDAA
jgi:endonuclease/exonuclease/phosphatase family metal-dependent hydrolase